MGPEFSIGLEYAYFDDELFELLGNGVARDLLKSLASEESK